MSVLLETQIEGIKLFKRGKVRDLYEVGEYLLMVATDRVSAFDVVLPDGIPDKGMVLTQISIFWFERTKDIVENHLVASDPRQYPEALRKWKDVLDGRSMLVKKASPLPVECIVRGYLSGSAYKEYKRTGRVCGIRLPDGLLESSRLDEPIFTPSTKATLGHDVNITFEEAERILGRDLATKIRDISLELYKRASRIAEGKGIIIADTKMEFGLYEGRLILIDELFTPDSSRFWSVKEYMPGRAQVGYDKQIIRDYLISLGWDGTPPAPSLPADLIWKSSERYREILGILTSEEAERSL